MESFVELLSRLRDSHEKEVLGEAAGQGAGPRGLKWVSTGPG